MKTLSLLIILLFSATSFAKVSALFHPYDPALETISQHILAAQKSIDIAMYNIDSSERNPIIKTIASEEIQKKINEGSLVIRMIFEGYETPEKNKLKMGRLEAFGIDVRHMASSKKMHHKYAVIDSNTDKAVLITGSANWSVMSQKNYNENILFFEQETETINSFQSQFDELWSLSKAYGFSSGKNSSQVEPQRSTHTYFNTDNFKVSRNKFKTDTKSTGFTLTRKVVASIDQAQDTLQIATTRFRLRPIYNAVLRAAKRGVKIDLLLTMGEYEYQFKRYKMKMKKCDDEYQRKCSTGQNFAVYLNRKGFEGHENINVRLKYFHVNKKAYLNKQMHSKYLIIDSKVLLTGSFNWSYSSEYNHIENLIELNSDELPHVIESFEEDFNYMWTDGRSKFKPFIEKLEKAAVNSETISCGFQPIALRFNDVDYMLNSSRRVKSKSSLRKLCRATQSLI